MKFCSPQVYLIGETRCSWGLPAFLQACGAGDWDTDSENSAEKLMEVCGRVCYRSWKPGLNKNVTKVRQGNREYLGNIIKQKHGQILEHGYVTFGFVGLSRVCTHEIIRHRAGASYSQESLRYVYPFPLSFRLPENLPPRTLEELVKAATEVEAAAKRLSEFLFPPGERKTFSQKKQDTSLLRRVLPMGMATTLIATYNHRALRHIIELRTSKHAEEEIRLVFSKVAEICKSEWPNVYQDMQRNEDGEWVFETSKI